MSCTHNNFFVQANIAKVTDTEEIEAIVAEITIKCEDCDTQFQFLELPLGLAYDRPTMSVDGLEARLPITPMGIIPKSLAGITGFAFHMERGQKN